MSESKEMKMLKELLRNTAYKGEYSDLAFMSNNTCEALTHLREWIDDLKQQRDDLRELCKEFMEKADNGSADFDDPEPGSIYLRAEAAIKKAQS